jgi:hypothetical protein
MTNVDELYRKALESRCEFLEESVKTLLELGEGQASVIVKFKDALTKIEALENTETNEWDCVERVMPEMAEIARNALKDTK